MTNVLDEIAIKHGTDKSSQIHNYTEGYYSVFSQLRERELKVLEIGVFNGASLRMWEEFFPNSQIFGIDKNPDALRHQTERTKIFIGDQADETFLKAVAHATDRLDIVIDDGSHHPEHQLLGLAAFFPHLNPDGIYVIEDLCCSYLKRYGPNAGLGNPGNTVEYLKGLLDVIHGEAQHGGRIGDEVTSNVKAVSFFPRIAFLFKGNPRARLPGYVGPDIRSPARRRPVGWGRSLRSLFRRR
jgi:hypothetical protein